MRAQHCYQIEAENSLPLLLLSKSKCLEGLHALDTVECNALSAQGFKGRLGDVGLISNEQGFVKKVYIGSGHDEEQKAIAHAVTKLPAGLYQVSKPLSREAMIAWSLAQYRFDHFKKQDDFTHRVLVAPAQHMPSILAEAQAIYHIRDLINMPANELGPVQLASVVKSLADEHHAEFKQIVGEDLLNQNFPAIHAVGRAAAQAPRLISLSWGEPDHPRVTLVGKGVCFDSGGLDLKPSNAMRLMKKDMGGAAQVIGLAQWLMSEKLPIRLQVLIPAVENAIGAEAFRPGDVLKMRNNLTVEVDNTDAEGRLVLADALVKACEEKPELLIDFATLTGAARVAVGTEIAAMFSNDDALADDLTQTAKTSDDPVWRMPLFIGYENMLQSSVADLVNSSDTPYAGAITAGLFLQRFVAENCSWVHFDVMAWNLSNKPGKPEGGEAMGMRTVGRYLLNRYRKSAL